MQSHSRRVTDNVLHPRTSCCWLMQDMAYLARFTAGSATTDLTVASPYYECLPVAGYFAIQGLVSTIESRSQAIGEPVCTGAILHNQSADQRETDIIAGCCWHAFLRSARKTRCKMCIVFRSALQKEHAAIGTLTLVAFGHNGTSL